MELIIGQKTLWRKLFSTYLLIGLLSLVVASVFFYFSSRRLIEERTSQQLTSVNNLAAKKVQLYLEQLKLLALQSTHRLKAEGHKTLQRSLSNSLEGLYLIDGNKIKVLKGPNLSKDDPIFSSVPQRFIPYGDSHFSLRVPNEGKSYLWIFNSRGFDEVLRHRDGFGSTGEIYLVGEDLKIKSASRFLERWEDVTVDNESSRESFKGLSGVKTVRDYRTVEVLSAFSPFQFDDLRFALLSEIDRNEVLEPLTMVTRDIVILCWILLGLTMFAAIIASRKVLRTIQSMHFEILDLNFKVLTAQEEERRKIALNLHDGVGQGLTVLKWGLSQLSASTDHEFFQQKVKELAFLCDETIKDVRGISNDLIPSTLKEFGCFIGIKEFLAKQEKLLGVKIDYLYSKDLEELRFIDGFEVNVFRMVQEFVQNSCKHAEASRLSVMFFFHQGVLRMRLEDNGKGMDPLAPFPKSLKHRADLLGGKMERLESSAGLAFLIEFPNDKIMP